jgi:hypothetical protein
MQEAQEGAKEGDKEEAKGDKEEAKGDKEEAKDGKAEEGGIATAPLLATAPTDPDLAGEAKPKKKKKKEKRAKRNKGTWPLLRGHHCWEEALGGADIHIYLYVDCKLSRLM